MICCTFAGHRDINPLIVKDALREQIKLLLEMDTSFCFYVGAMGAFDVLCAQCVIELKKDHPKKQIRLTLVEPDLPMGSEWTKQYAQYDDVIRMIHRETAYREHPIIERNRWMADHSQYLIACVYRQNGGAFRTLTYAEQSGITVFRITPAAGE